MTDPSAIDRIFPKIEQSLRDALNQYDCSVETQCAAISALIGLASGMASTQPKAGRQHWAKVLYKYADRLACQEDDEDKEAT